MKMWFAEDQGESPPVGGLSYIGVKLVDGLVRFISRLSLISGAL